MNVGRRFILVGDPERADLASSLFDGQKVNGRSKNREYVTVWGKYHGKSVAVMGTGIGTDNTEIATVELHALNEYRHKRGSWASLPSTKGLVLIRVGTSASPQSDVQLGTLAIGKHAIGLDNTGLFYLHEPAESLHYAADPDSMFYTPGSKMARDIWLQFQETLPPFARHAIKPYVSTASLTAVEALARVAAEMKRLGQDVEHEIGITTSASGFYGPQGRSIGRLSNILIPDLQSRLARLRVGNIRVAESESLAGQEDGANIRPACNEMESSLLFRLAEILGYSAGSVCSVVANRAKGAYITPQEFRRSIVAGLKVGLEAIISIDT